MKTFIIEFYAGMLISGNPLHSSVVPNWTQKYIFFVVFR
jgi:hypothetical protein